MPSLQKDQLSKSKEFLPFLFTAEKIKAREASKLDIFEKGLSNEIKKSDTIEIAIKRIVKMALAAEFGTGLLTSSHAKSMIDTITYGIMHDDELRKQALLIIDKFAS